MYKCCYEKGIKTAPLDISSYLDDEETITTYLAAARAGGDTAMYLQAAKDVARARNQKS